MMGSATATTTDPTAQKTPKALAKASDRTTPPTSSAASTPAASSASPAAPATSPPSSAAALPSPSAACNTSGAGAFSSTGTDVLASSALLASAASHRCMFSFAPSSHLFILASNTSKGSSGGGPSSGKGSLSGSF